MTPWAPGFDIRRPFVPGYPTQYDNDPAVQRYYDQVNIMIYLMHDIAYGSLYENVRPTAGKWSRRFKALSDPRQTIVPQEDGYPMTGLPALAAFAHNAMIDIQQTCQQNANETISLHTFFWESPGNFTKAESAVYESFRLISEQDTGGFLCIPFVDNNNIKGPAGADNVRPSNSDMAQHRNTDVLTKRSIYQLYVEPPPKDERPALIAAIRFGRDKRILRSGKPTLIMTGTGGNNRICNAQTHQCQFQTGSWCSQDEEGNCSAMGG
ncbi:MAG: hypothetical protein KJ052_06445 [Candidatus Hydrogenedentes bacterium]|nr:hypothetical protein [Candidatus Hydrogenedentota bacterium]